jgi:hypothetical protein
MAVMVFTVLNGLGVIFLLYVLVQFWKEQHRTMKPVRRGQLIELSVKSKPTVVVVTRLVSGALPFGTQGKQVEPAPVSGGLQVEPAPVSQNAYGRLSVVSREARGAVLQDATSYGDSSNGAGEAPIKRFSTR